MEKKKIKFKKVNKQVNVLLGDSIMHNVDIAEVERHTNQHI